MTTIMQVARAIRKHPSIHHLDLSVLSSHTLLHLSSRRSFCRLFTRVASGRLIPTPVIRVYATLEFVLVLSF